MSLDFIISIDLMHLTLIKKCQALALITVLVLQVCTEKVCSGYHRVKC